jgi:2'-5' RNA ligase
VAIELPPEVLDALEGVQSRLRRVDGGQAARWVARESIHLTLKFLGKVPQEGLDEIHEAVRRACAVHAPFTVATAAPGCFPNVRRPRVVWVGLHDDGRLAALQRDVETGLARLGYAAEDRPFSPHLTLARARQHAVRSDVEALGQAVAHYGQVEPVSFVAREVCVIRSDLRPQGAVYTILSRAPLIGERND